MLMNYKFINYINENCVNGGVVPFNCFCFTALLGAETAYGSLC